MNIFPIDTTSTVQAGESLAGGLASTGLGEDAAPGSFESVLLAASPVGVSIQSRTQSQNGGAMLAQPDAQSEDAAVSSTPAPVTSVASAPESATPDDLTDGADPDVTDENVSKKQGNGQSPLGDGDWSQLVAAQAIQSMLTLASPSVAVVTETSKGKASSTSSVAEVGAVSSETRGATAVEKLTLRFAGPSFSAVPTGKSAITETTSKFSAQPQSGLKDIGSLGEADGAMAPMIASVLQESALLRGENAEPSPLIGLAHAGESQAQTRLNGSPSAVTGFGSMSASQAELAPDFPSRPEGLANSQVTPALTSETQDRPVQQAVPDMVRTAPVALRGSARTQKLEVIPNGFARDQKARLNGAGSSTESDSKLEPNSLAPEMDSPEVGVRQGDANPAVQEAPAFALERVTVPAATEQPTRMVPVGDSSVRISVSESYPAEPITTNPFIRRESKGDSDVVVRPVRFLASSADIRAISRQSKDPANIEEAILSDTGPQLAKVPASEEGSSKPFVLSEPARKPALLAINESSAKEIFPNLTAKKASLSTDSATSSKPAAPSSLRNGDASQRAPGQTMAAQFVVPGNRPALKGNTLNESGPASEFSAPQTNEVQIQGRSQLHQNLSGTAGMSGMEKAETLERANGETPLITLAGENVSGDPAPALQARRTGIDSLAGSSKTTSQAALSDNSPQDVEVFRTGVEDLRTSLSSASAAADQTGLISSAKIERNSQAPVLDGNVRDALKVSKGLEGTPVKAEKFDDISPMHMPGRHLHAAASPVSSARIVVPADEAALRFEANPVIDAVKQGQSRFPRLDRGGIVDAQQTERMVSTKENDLDLDLGGQNMPNFGKNDSPSRSAFQVPVASEPNRARQEFSSNRISELALASNQLLDKAENSRGLAESAGAVRNELHARVTERIWSAVETFRSSGSNNWVVRIRPDEGMELNLRLKVQENQIVIHARLDSGNWDAVAPSWRDLQAHLANRGVQLQPLEGSGGQGSFSQPQHNPMNSESNDQRQYTEQDRRNASDLREMDFRFGAEVLERKKPQLTTKSPLSGNGWESWA